MSRIKELAETQKLAKRKKTRKPKGKRNAGLAFAVIAIPALSAVAVAYFQNSNYQATRNITPSVNASANSAVAIGGNAVAVSGNGNNSPVMVNGDSERPSREDKFLEILKATGKLIDSVKREQTNDIPKLSSTSPDVNGKF